MKLAYIDAPKTAGPWVDIDLDALCANYAMIRATAPGAEVAAAVKCDGYGLGAGAVSATLAEREGCRTFFVAYPEEGAALRQHLRAIAPAPEIYVFNGPTPKTMALFKEHALTPVLNTTEQAHEWAAANPGAPAALHADTGLNRYGAPISDLHAISEMSGLNITLFMSHLACASAPENEMNRRQRDLFITASAKFPEARKSLAASGGALIGDRYHFDMLRVGIALYGGSPFDDPDPRIKPVAALRAPVIQIRNARAGETVGYDATQKLRRDSVLATVALGYGDGFPRAASNRASGYINGAVAPIAGRVSMDLITLDVSDLPDRPKIGDIAEFFGPHAPIHDTARAEPYHTNCSQALADALIAATSRRRNTAMRGMPR